MKKTYVKPVMESEAFIANEYVAACYYVHCIGMDDARAKTRSGHRTAWLRYNDDEHAGNEVIKEYVHGESAFTGGRTVEYYHSGLIPGSFKSPEYIDKSGQKHWDVELSPLPAGDPHPNASV